VFDTVHTVYAVRLAADWRGGKKELCIAKSKNRMKIGNSQISNK